MNWRSELRPTDIPNPVEPGEPLYVWAKIRPAWYWQLKRIGLFLSIVWRKWEDERIGIALAWDVSRVAIGETR